jgi:hypothetical protein
MFSVCLLLCYYSPLGKDVPLHLYNLELYTPKDDLCQVRLKLAQWFWRRRRKCKSLQTDRQTDDRQRLIRKAHLTFQLRWAKNYSFVIILNIIRLIQIWSRVVSTCVMSGSLKTLTLAHHKRFRKHQSTKKNNSVVTFHIFRKELYHGHRQRLHRIWFDRLW